MPYWVREILANAKKELIYILVSNNQSMFWKLKWKVHIFRQKIDCIETK